MHFEPVTQTNTDSANTDSAVAPVTVSTTRLAATAVLFGTALIFLAGFAELPVVHDAAHDMRHAAGFPCH